MRQVLCVHCGRPIYWQPAQNEKEQKIVSKRFEEHLATSPWCLRGQKFYEEVFFQAMNGPLDPALLPEIDTGSDILFRSTPTKRRSL